MTLLLGDLSGQPCLKSACVSVVAGAGGLVTLVAKANASGVATFTLPAVDALRWVQATTGLGQVSPVRPLPDCLDAYDPLDDGPAGAVLAADGVEDATLCPGDVDVRAVDVVAGDTLRGAFVARAAGHQPELELRDPSGAPVATPGWKNADDGWSFSVPSAAPGRWTVVLRPASGLVLDASGAEYAAWFGTQPPPCVPSVSGVVSSAHDVAVTACEGASVEVPIDEAEQDFDIVSYQGEACFEFTCGSGRGWCEIPVIAWRSPRFELTCEVLGPLDEAPVWEAWGLALGSPVLVARSPGLATWRFDSVFATWSDDNLSLGTSAGAFQRGLSCTLGIPGPNEGSELVYDAYQVTCLGDGP